MKEDFGVGFTVLVSGSTRTFGFDEVGGVRTSEFQHLEPVRTIERVNAMILHLVHASTEC